jgi:hypothetical protein
MGVDSSTPVLPRANDRVRVSIEGAAPFCALVEYTGRDSLLLMTLESRALVLFATVPGEWETEHGRVATVEIVAPRRGRDEALRSGKCSSALAMLNNCPQCKGELPDVAVISKCPWCHAALPESTA